MGQMLAYSGITTKIKSMEGRFLKKKDGLTLASMQNTTEFIVFLKQHESYSTLFAHLDENTLHRSQIEAILTNSKYNEYAKLYRFSTVEQRRFLDIYFKRFEIDMIKTCLRMVFAKRAMDYNLWVFQEFFSTHSHINLTALSQCSNINELLSALKGTSYYSLLNNMNGDNLTLFDYENTLDTNYYTYYWKIKDKTLTGDNLLLITNEIGTEIDLYNLLSLFRIKTYFKISNFDYYRYLVPLNYKLKRDEIQKMIDSTTRDEFFELFKTTYYYRRYHKLYKDNLEMFCKKVTALMHISNKRKYPYSIASITNFLYKKEEEIRKLTTTLECIRYQIDVSQSLQYLQTGGDSFD